MSKRAKILVVDADPMTGEVFSRISRDEAFEISVTNCPEEALRTVREQRPDLVIAGAMAERSEFCRKLEADAALADVWMVRWVDESVVEKQPEREAKGNGNGKGLVLKPSNAEELSERIGMLLRLREMTLALRASEQQHRRALEDEVAARERAEEAETKYRSIFENATEGIDRQS